MARAPAEGVPASDFSVTYSLVITRISVSYYCKVVERVQTRGDEYPEKEVSSHIAGLRKDMES